MGSRSALAPKIDGWLSFKLNLTTDSQVIYNGPCVLKAIHINTTISAHAVDINNGGTGVFKIPASATQGTRFDFDETEFLTNLTIDPDNSATGIIVVVYKPYPNV